MKQEIYIEAQCKDLAELVYLLDKIKPIESQFNVSFQFNSENYQNDYARHEIGFNSEIQNNTTNN